MPGKNKWVNLTFDGLPQRLSKENFQIEFTSTTDRTISFQQACAESAHEIWDTYRRIHISLSGGCDSECVANSFYDNQVPFTPVIISLGDQNRHDIKFALKWCEKRNIQPVVLEFTLDQWVIKNTGQNQKSHGMGVA
jgi:asparagine synthetase B (glutamine-hydrolysing)